MVYGSLFIAPMVPVGAFGTLDARSHGAGWLAAGLVVPGSRSDAGPRPRPPGGLNDRDRRAATRQRTAPGRPADRPSRSRATGHADAFGRAPHPGV